MDFKEDFKRLEASTSHGTPRYHREIDQRLAADQEAIVLLDTIPGVGQRAAEILIAEIGTDMSRFPSAKHLASWAGMCPGNYEKCGRSVPTIASVKAFTSYCTPGE